MSKFLLILCHVSYSLLKALHIEMDGGQLLRGLANINVRESPGNRPVVVFRVQVRLWGGVHGSLDSLSVR